MTSEPSEHNNIFTKPAADSVSSEDAAKETRTKGSRRHHGSKNPDGTHRHRRHRHRLPSTTDLLLGPSPPNNRRDSTASSINSACFGQRVNYPGEPSPASPTQERLSDRAAKKREEDEKKKEEAQRQHRPAPVAQKQQHTKKDDLVEMVDSDQHECCSHGTPYGVFTDGTGFGMALRYYCEHCQICMQRVHAEIATKNPEVGAKVESCQTGSVAQIPMRESEQTEDEVKPVTAITRISEAQNIAAAERRGSVGNEQMEEGLEPMQPEVARTEAGLTKGATTRVQQCQHPHDCSCTYCDDLRN